MENFFKLFGKLSAFFVAVIVINSLIGDISFRLKYKVAVPSDKTEKIITTYNEPLQRNLSETKYLKAKGEKKEFALKAEAEYSISGLVVARNSNFWFRDIMRSKFDDIALLDLGIVWGDLARDNDILYENVKFKSVKTPGQARQLQPKCLKGGCPSFPWDWNYFNSHVSHNHLIASNPNIMSALLKIKVDDTVKLEGYLVDVYTDKSDLIAMTSLSRDDNNATSRGVGNGGGACEILYVTEVQLGNKIYR